MTPWRWWHLRYHRDNTPGARLIPCEHCFQEWRSAHNARLDAMYARHAEAMAAIRARIDAMYAEHDAQVAVIQGRIDATLRAWRADLS